MFLPKLTSFQELHTRSRFYVMILFAIVAALEFSTPASYVFGDLYIAPILLCSIRLSRTTTRIVTIAACILTMSNLWIPDFAPVEPSTIASRAIATGALIVTGILCDRSRLYQQALLQQQAKLQAQEKLSRIREDFTSTLAHDLKTPLLGAIETLKAFQTGGFGTVQETQQTVLSTMIRSHQTTLKLVETLLDVYRNDAEGLKLDLEPVDLVEIAEEVATTLRQLATSRRVHLSFNYGESDFRKFLWVKGDALQLQRVIANLLTNAINHSPRGGKVEVVLEPSASFQTVKIIDTGAGITAAELPSLFKRFYQGQSDRQASGSGLGLYLSRQIIEAHNGIIWAENRQPNGAIFAFRLPALPFQFNQ